MNIIGRIGISAVVAFGLFTNFLITNKYMDFSNISSVISFTVFLCFIELAIVAALWCWGTWLIDGSPDTKEVKRKGDEISLPIKKITVPEEMRDGEITISPDDEEDAFNLIGRSGHIEMALLSLRKLNEPDCYYDSSITRLINEKRLVDEEIESRGIKSDMSSPVNIKENT